MFKTLLVIQLLVSFIVSAVVYHQFKNVNPQPIRHALASASFGSGSVGWLNGSSDERNRTTAYGPALGLRLKPNHRDPGRV